MTEAPPKKSDPKSSDLAVRTASAIVMVAVAGAALWHGGWVWAAFVGAVGLGVLWEWWGLTRKITQSWWARALWLAGGVVYVGVACTILADLRRADIGFGAVAFILAAVTAVDIGAYFAGRTIGGPKIAPKISPSKTWAGLVGGMVMAATVAAISTEWMVLDDSYQTALLGLFVAAGALIAIIAQAGDFFESWMKRRAGVKDSGALIPGHGGLFDRVDGLLAVCFVLGVMLWVGR